MKMHRLNKVILAAVASSAVMMTSAGIQADNLDAVLKVGEARHQAARTSQVKIDKLSEETRDLLNDYKTVMKQVDGLKVYNARLDRQIDNQNKRMAKIENSISNVTVIQRQIMPLLLRMLDSLEQFVALDVPFNKEERLEQLAMVRENVDRSDLNTAEKFRQVLELYKIESEYGRSVSTYMDTVSVNGVDTEVEMLRVGRVALMYQTTDKQTTGAWNTDTQSWEVLDSGEYASAVRQGINMANKTVTIDILKVPVSAPEAK